ncbi:MAG: DUF4173 domain-containing protein [Clostridiales bacterium]|nr:DUF4173 domain-containing protein [Clostridiales bacterium]
MDKKVIFQRLGVLLAYPLAYAYIRLMISGYGEFYVRSGWFSISVAYPLLAVLFILVNEIVRRGRRGASVNPSYQTVFWYVMMILSGSTATMGPSEDLSVFAMHLCAVYSVLVSNNILLGGKTSGFIPADLIHGLYVKSFAGFPNFITDWGCFKRSVPSEGETETRRKNPAGAVIFIAVMAVLLIISVSLMASIDEDINLFFSNITRWFGDYFRNIELNLIMFRVIFAIPVCFYLYGLMSRSAKSDGEREKRVAQWLTRIRGKGKTVSSTIVYIAAGVFVRVYILFFIKRLAYMLGGFVGRVPDKMLVSQYAREGFFELVGIMAVNMCVYLVIILLGKTDSNGKFSLPSKILVTLLMSESIIFAIIAMSKLGLYYSRFGYTPKRILAMWGSLALGFAAAMTIATVFRGKPHFRAGVIFTAVSYIAICILSGVLMSLSF